MPVDEKALEALDLKNLVLPPSLPVIAVEGYEYTDSSGDAALRVLVTLKEETDVENVPGEDVGKLKSAIHDSLRCHGVSLRLALKFA